VTKLPGSFLLNPSTNEPHVLNFAGALLEGALREVTATELVDSFAGAFAIESKEELFETDIIVFGK
jgi:hypothetical protein